MIQNPSLKSNPIRSRLYWKNSNRKRMRLKNRRNCLLYHNEKRGVTILRLNKPVYLACVIQML